MFKIPCRRSQSYSPTFALPVVSRRPKYVIRQVRQLIFKEQRTTRNACGGPSSLRNRSYTLPECERRLPKIGAMYRTDLTSITWPDTVVDLTGLGT